MAGKEPEVGPTSRTVADNVSRLRTAQRLTYTQLSERLRDAAGWSINAVGIRRIECGQRRVTPDDLVALSVALGVSPITLLMPDVASADTRIEVTGLRRQHTAEQVWEWLGATSLGYFPIENVDLEGFFRRAWPIWLQAKWGDEWLAGRNQIQADVLEKSRQFMALREEQATGNGDDQ